MDDIQKNLVAMVNEQPSCLKDRKQLKAVLMDYLPQNKLQQNLILNAYDEDVVGRLTPSADVTLHALQTVKVLSDDYGITKSNAFWVVCSWCYMLNLSEIASILEENTPSEQKQSDSSGVDAPQSQVTVGLGIYKAGVDIPSGELKITVNQKSRLGINYGISKNPNRIDTNKDFMDQAYINIEDGQYLKLYCFETGGHYTMTITKV